MEALSRRLGARWIQGLFIALAATVALSSTAQADVVVYDDALAPGWENWSWAVTDPAHTGTVHSGSTSLAVTPTAWSSAYLRSAAAPLDTQGLLNVTFWVHGGATGGQQLRLVAVINDVAQPGIPIAALAPNVWQRISIPLSSLGAENRNDVNGFWIQEGTGQDSPTFYVDDVVLESGVPPTPPLRVDGMGIYDDALINGWQNWSWASVNTASTANAHTGSTAIAVTAGPFAALYLQHNAFPTQPYATLKFWINGGPQGGQTVNVRALLNGVAQAPRPIGPLAANTWREVAISLADLGVANAAALTGIWLQEGAGVAQPTFYVDDVGLEFAPPPSVVNVRVDPKRTLRQVDSRLFGINAAVWDGAFYSPNTTSLLKELSNNVLRFPGGSLSDVYHWATNTSEGQTFQWATNFDEFAEIAISSGASVFITANYGTGTPEEAAEWVRYSNKIKNYRFRHWEIGNENYGTWEADNNDRPHDPVTYATRFRDYWIKMKAVDPSIKIGAVVARGEDSEVIYTDHPVTNPRTGEVHLGWTPVMLTTLRNLGITPDFVIYHRYEQGPGGESDLFLLNSAATWTNDAANLRQMVDDYLGPNGRSVALICTENNSVYSNPGKQTTSLVNGLFLADSIGSILQTEFKGMVWWDLRNGREAGNNNSSSLYGWRRYGDYGMVNEADPAGPADRYPTFYVYKLLKYFARGGEYVIPAQSDYTSLGVYAVRVNDRVVRLLLINKHPSATINASIAIPGLKKGRKARVYSYGIPQDEAARTGEGSADIEESQLTIAGSTLNYSPAPYSAVVLDLEVDVRKAAASEN